MPGSSPARKTAPKKEPGSRAGELSAAAIRTQLEDILASDEFSKSDRLCRFMRLTVNWALTGQAEKLKEYVLGRDVFDRGPRYDPRADSIVRVEAYRLRTKLRQYYETHATARIRIEFRSGSYVPVFQRIIPGAAEAGESPAVTSIAVLPFKNLGPAPDRDYLCDGVTEAILHKLATVPGLRVVAWTSVYRFKGKTGDVRKIGRILSAGTVVEGSIRRVGKQIRVSALAVKSSDGCSLWSGKFDRKIEDIFAIQDEIASAVAGALRMRLEPAASTKVVNLGAYKLYLKGRHHSDHGEFEIAISDFKRATALFPDYAPGFAGLADAYSWFWLMGLARPDDTVPKARQAALEALRLDPQLAAAQVSLGALACWHDWKWDEGAELFRQAIEIEPSSVMALSYYGAQFVNRGAFSDAMVFLERALRLDPLSVQTHWMLGWARYLEREYDKSIEWVKKGLELKEGWRLRVLLGWAHLGKRQYAEAVEEFRKALTGQAIPFALSGLGEAYARWGKQRDAERVLRRMESLAQTTYVPATSHANVYVGLGRRDLAMEWLERGYREHSTGLGALATDQRYDALRSDARWKGLLARIGLAAVECPQG